MLSDKFRPKILLDLQDQDRLYHNLEHHLANYFPLTNFNNSASLNISSVDVNFTEGYSLTHEISDNITALNFTPYVCLFIFKCEDTNSYKSSTKLLINKFIEVMNKQHQEWLLLYVTLKSRTASNFKQYNKIFSHIKSDLSNNYKDRAFKFCINDIDNPETDFHSQLNLFISKLKNLVYNTFEYRLNLFLTELTTVSNEDNKKNIASIFSTHCLMRESITFLYLQMNLYNEALRQFDLIESEYLVVYKNVFKNDESTVNNSVSFDHVANVLTPISPLGYLDFNVFSLSKCVKRLSFVSLLYRHQLFLLKFLNRPLELMTKSIEFISTMSSLIFKNTIDKNTIVLVLLWCIQSYLTVIEILRNFSSLPVTSFFFSLQGQIYLNILFSMINLGKILEYPVFILPHMKFPNKDAYISQNHYLDKSLLQIFSLCFLSPILQDTPKSYSAFQSTYQHFLDLALTTFSTAYPSAPKTLDKIDLKFPPKFSHFIIIIKFLQASFLYSSVSSTPKSITSKQSFSNIWATVSFLYKHKNWNYLSKANREYAILSKPETLQSNWIRLHFSKNSGEKTLSDLKLFVLNCFELLLLENSLNFSNHSIASIFNIFYSNILNSEDIKGNMLSPLNLSEDDTFYFTRYFEIASTNFSRSTIFAGEPIDLNLNLYSHFAIKIPVSEISFKLFDSSNKVELHLRSSSFELIPHTFTSIVLSQEISLKPNTSYTFKAGNLSLSCGLLRIMKNFEISLPLIFETTFSPLNLNLFVSTSSNLLSINPISYITHCHFHGENKFNEYYRYLIYINIASKYKIINSTLTIDGIPLQEIDKKVPAYWIDEKGSEFETNSSILLSQIKNVIHLGSFCRNSILRIKLLSAYQPVSSILHKTITATLNYSFLSETELLQHSESIVQELQLLSPIIIRYSFHSIEYNKEYFQIELFNNLPTTISLTFIELKLRDFSISSNCITYNDNSQKILSFSSLFLLFPLHMSINTNAIDDKECEGHLSVQFITNDESLHLAWCLTQIQKSDDKYHIFIDHPESGSLFQKIFFSVTITSEVADEKELFYQILFDYSDWLLEGKYQEKLLFTSTQVKFKFFLLPQKNGILFPPKIIIYSFQDNFRKQIPHSLSCSYPVIKVI